MKLNVTFKSDVSVDRGKHPVGEEFALHLAGAFNKAGIQITSIDNYDDIGWALETTLANRQILLVLGHVGEDDFEWLMQIIPCKSFFCDIFKPHAGLKECETLATAVHKILCSDNSINTIRWHQGHYSKENSTSRPDGN